MSLSVVYADLKFAAGSPSTIPDEDDNPYENVMPGPVNVTPSPGHLPRRWRVPTGLLAASLLLILLVAVVALGACYWQVTRSLQDTSRNHTAEQSRLSQELSTREQSLEQTQLELAWARAELQQAWHESNISQLELERLNTELGHVIDVLGKTEKEMQEVQRKLNNSESTVISLRACVNTECCPSGWVLYRSKCLFISMKRNTWWNSYWDCKQKSAKLLTQGNSSPLTAPELIAQYWIEEIVFSDTKAASVWNEKRYTTCRAVAYGQIKYLDCKIYLQWICEQSPKLSSTAETQSPFLTKD